MLIKKREKPLDSDVKTQQHQKPKTRRKNNFPSITRLKAVIVSGLNIGCLGSRFGPDFGVVPVHG